MDGIENVGLSAAVLSEKSNYFFVEVELDLPVITKVLETKLLDEHGPKLNAIWQLSLAPLFSQSTE